MSCDAGSGRFLVEAGSESAQPSSSSSSSGVSSLPDANDADATLHKEHNAEDSSGTSVELENHRGGALPDSGTVDPDSIAAAAVDSKEPTADLATEGELLKANFKGRLEEIVMAAMRRSVQQRELHYTCEQRSDNCFVATVRLNVPGLCGSVEHVGTACRTRAS